MILADTSIWIDHFRKANRKLAEALASRDLTIHELVVAELALGSVPNRSALLADLALLPMLAAAGSADLIAFVTERHLYASGIGYVDAQLLLAAHNSGVSLWTRDRRLAAQAERLGLAFRAD